MGKKKLYDLEVMLSDDTTGLTEGNAYYSVERGKDNFGQQTTVSPEEKAEREATGHTQGRKGCKLKRMSLGLRTKNYDYIRTMAPACGMTYGEFVNRCIELDYHNHIDDYNRAKKFVKVIRSEREDEY